MTTQATKRSTERATESPYVASFDVTCVVGTVQLGGGGRDPYVAAFDLIATHGAEGRFSFPMPQGTVHVTVEHETPEPDNR